MVTTRLAKASTLVLPSKTLIAVVNVENQGTRQRRVTSIKDNNAAMAYQANGISYIKNQIGASKNRNSSGTAGKAKQSDDPVAQSSRGQTLPITRCTSTNSNPKHYIQSHIANANQMKARNQSASNLLNLSA